MDKIGRFSMARLKLLNYWRVKEMNKYIMINHDASINEEMHVENSMAHLGRHTEKGQRRKRS